MRVSDAVSLDPDGRVARSPTLLLLEAVVFGYSGLEKLARWVVFGRDEDLGFVLWSYTSVWAHTGAGGHEGTVTAQNLLVMVARVWTYIYEDTPTEAGPAIEPVIVLELVDLYALAIVGRWRYQCHSR